MFPYGVGADYFSHEGAVLCPADGDSIEPYRI